MLLSTRRTVFEFGCGAATFAARLLQRYLPADARYVGLDISSTMVSLAQQRLKPWPGRARVYPTDGCPRIPEPDHSFDHFVSTYVFDLLAPGFTEQLLSEGRRLLVPGGRFCLVSLAFGTSRFSRAVCWGWQSSGNSVRASWVAAVPLNSWNICRLKIGIPSTGLH